MSLVVRPVLARRDRKEFIELPYRLHSSSGVWVPPLRLERRLFLSPRQNSFFSHGAAQLFVAERDGRVVGRISAQYDDAFNRFHGNRWGMFGFLELEDDPEILPSLLDAAAGWLRAHGRDHMIGPMDFTLNDESGVMIEGFERRPMIKQPWHPPYYRARCEEAGLTKAMDLLMYEIEIGDRRKVQPAVLRLAEQVEPRHGIRIRHMTRRSLRRDMDRFAEVYNSAWSRNWGFVSYSERDLDVYAQELQLVFDRNWFMVAETADGDTAAVAITVLDANQVLVKMNGRLLPLGWWHFLRRARHIDRVRVGFLGVKPEYQHTGVAAALYVEHYDMGEHASQARRDGVDPRDQPQHEPGDGGAGRARRPPLPRLRTVAVNSADPHGYCVAMDRSEYLKASPPMFKSGLLDRFTRVHHLVPVVIFLPAIVVLFVLGVGRLGLLSAVLYAVGGYAFWTLAEYWIHRGVFHFEPEEGLGARLHWMVHGVHHDHPNDPLRLVMPPAASVPLALIFYVLFWLVLGADRATAFGAGFLAGYLAYDMIHYHLHHHTPTTRVGKWLRELHMRHHFQDDTRGYGISAPYWDRVFGTMATRPRRRTGA